MARKRINTRFLIILLAVVVGGGAAAFVARAVLIREKPHRYIALGDELMEQRDFDKAARNYARAISLNPQDADVLVKYGDCLRELTRTNYDLIGKDKGMWDRALEVDPNHVGALQRLLTFYLDEAQIIPQSAVFSKMRDVAVRIHRIDPNDKRAEAYISIAIIQSWLLGVETSAAAIDQCVADLTALLEKDPANAELPLHIALAHIKRGEEFQRTNQQKEADKVFQQAAQVLEGAIKGQEQNAAMHFRTARGFTALSLADAARGPQYTARATELLEAARKLVTAEDERYVDVYMASADLMIRQNDLAGAEQLLRDMYAQLPQDQSVRLSLARLLSQDSAKREEAIKLLDQPAAGAEGMLGLKALHGRELELQSLAHLIQLRIDSYTAAKDDAERKTLLDKIQEGYTQLNSKTGEVPVTMKLKGKIQLLKGESVEAIQTLSRAKQLYDQQGFRGADYYDLTYLLARAYFATNQTGQAKALLAQVLEKYDRFTQARLLLVQLLLRERNFTEAKPHHDLLLKQAPDDPDVQRLGLAFLDTEKQKEEVRKNFARLPEKSRAEQMNKAQAALILNLTDEAVRLLRLTLAGDPGDTDAAVLLVRVYVFQNQKDLAQQVVDAALKVKPDHGGLRYLREQLSDASPERLMKIREELTGEIADEFAREMQLAQLARERDKQDEVLVHLRNAQKIKPDDGNVLDQLFRHLLDDRQYDEAAKLLEGLAKANKDQAKGQLYRFRLSMAKGDVSAALATARQLTTDLPEFAQSWLSLAQALHVSSEYDQALAKYIVAMEKQSSNIEAMRGIIDCYYRLNRAPDAKRAIAQARQQFPADPYFQELEVNHELNYGNPELAIKPREEALAGNKDQPSHWLALGSAYLRVAQVKGTGGDQKAASAYLTKARDLFKQALDKWPDERIFYAYLAESAALLGDQSTAERTLQQMASREAWKDRPEPHLMLTDLYARTGNLDEAEQQLRTAFAKSQNGIDVQLQLANFLGQRRKLDDAMKVLDEANATDPRVQRQRIELLINSGKLPDAEQQLRASLGKTPNDSGLLSLLGLVYINSQKWDLALEQLNKALAADSRNWTALYWRGLLRLQQPKPEPTEAIKDLQAVRDLNPSNAEARFTLAEAYRRINDPEAAIRELEATLKIIPANKAVRMKLIELCSTTNPPRWADVDRLMREAKTMPQFQGDADWLQVESNTWMARGDGDKAVAAIQAALKTQPANPNYVRSYLGLLLQLKRWRPLLQETEQLAKNSADAWWMLEARGIAKRNLGDKDGALGEFDSALKVANDLKDDAAVQALVRTISREVGLDAAIQRAQERAKDNNRWKLICAFLYQQKEDYTSALTLVESVLKEFDQLSDPEQETALRFAATIYLTAKPVPQMEKAHSLYLRLLDKAPNDLAALNNLACLLAEGINPPQPEEALRYSQRAYDIMQKHGAVDPMIMDTHGWVLTLCGRAEEGINLLQQVVDRRPFPDAHYHLGEAYLRRAFPEEAQRQLLAALNLIEKAQKDSQPFDPVLKAKVDASLARAREMIRAKSEAKLQ